MLFGVCCLFFLLPPVGTGRAPGWPEVGRVWACAMPSTALDVRLPQGASVVGCACNPSALESGGGGGSIESHRNACAGVSSPRWKEPLPSACDRLRGSGTPTENPPPHSQPGLWSSSTHGLAHCGTLQHTPEFWDTPKKVCEVLGLPSQSLVHSLEVSTACLPARSLGKQAECWPTVTQGGKGRNEGQLG